MPPRIPSLTRLRRPQLSSPWAPRPIRLNSTAAATPTLQTQPPPTAPKPTIDLKSIRADTDAHVKNCIDRNYRALAEYPLQIVDTYREWVTVQGTLRTEQKRANELSVSLRKATGPEREAILSEAQTVKAKATEIEIHERELDRKMKALALALPNSTSAHSPIGTEPKVLEYINPHLAPKPEDMNRDVKTHIQIGAELKLLDFADAGVVSGWGWYYLLNEAVLLEQALVNYALSLSMKSGWGLVTPPSIVYSHMAAACGFRPRDQHGEQQIYLLNEGKHALAGTAEIPLAGMNANKTFEPAEMAKKVVGVGRAYRAEAGARGVDSKGLYRVHEFTKVELFAWAPPVPAEGEVPIEGQSAEDVFNEMLELQKTFLGSLGLYARILEMPTTDLGASASRKIDIEAYMPSRVQRDPWGEVSSLSNCTDYQSRRLNTRVKLPGGSGKKTVFPYTLNGTACAVPRVMIAILENGWSAERGGVVVPEVLRPFMGDIEFIGKKKK